MKLNEMKNEYIVGAIIHPNDDVDTERLQFTIDDCGTEWEYNAELAHRFTREDALGLISTARSFCESYVEFKLFQLTDVVIRSEQARGFVEVKS